VLLLSVYRLDISISIEYRTAVCRSQDVVRRVFDRYREDRCPDSHIAAVGPFTASHNDVVRVSNQRNTVPFIVGNLNRAGISGTAWPEWRPVV
jgi:hypothetical protein